MSKRLWFVCAFVLLFAAAMVGQVSAATETQGGTNSIIVGDPAGVPSNVRITEAFQLDLFAVEDVSGLALHTQDQFDGIFDGFADLPAPVYLRPTCGGDRFSYTVGIDQPNVTWNYANVWIPGNPGFAAIFPLGPNQDADNDGTNDIRLLAAVADLRLGSNRGSDCYEYGHPISIRNDLDPASGFASAFDGVIVAIANNRVLVIDQLRRSTQPATPNGTPGRLVIPGGSNYFTVDTSSAAGATPSAAEAPLTVTVSPGDTTIANIFGDLGNPGVSQETVQVATLVSRETPGGEAGTDAQVQAEGDQLLRVIIGEDDQLANNLRIVEQVNRQFILGNNSQIRISLPNGVQFAQPPEVGFAGGLEAFLRTTSGYPTSTIVIDVDQNLNAADAAQPGAIRIFNIRLNVNEGVQSGPVTATVEPVRDVLNNPTINGLVTSDVDIAIAVPRGAIGGTGAGSNVQQTVSVSDLGIVSIFLDVSPETQVTGEVFVTVTVEGVGDQDIDGQVFYRPSDNLVPIIVTDPETGETFNLYITLQELPYKPVGTLRTNDPDVRFDIGLAGLEGLSLEISSRYRIQDSGVMTTIQTVTLFVVP